MWTLCLFFGRQASPGSGIARSHIEMKKSTTKVRKPASRANRPKKTVNFLHKPNCATCRKARRFLDKHGYQLRCRDLSKERLSSAELEKLIGKHDYEEFLNPHSELYRKNKMRDDPPSRGEAIRMMARDPSLIRRPVVVAGGRVVIGYDENGMIRF
jgi:Spx/MgsR family transcriptional regulator